MTNPIPRKVVGLPNADTQQRHRQLPVQPVGVGGTVEPKHYDWLNPMNKVLLVAVFRAKKNRVKLDHREYKIDYSRRKGYAWVSPKSDDEYVPCGWFELDRVTKKEWVVTN